MIVSTQEGTFGTFDVKADFADITDDPRYRAALAALEVFPERSLLTPRTRAHLYFLIRAMDYRNVLEIGTYLAGTTELLARTVAENGRGTVVTLDPATASGQVLETIGGWPPPIRDMTSFKPISSGDFFYIGSLHDRREFDLIFVDGNHVYDYALFDLTLSAQRLRPGEILAVDNAEISGVFYALRSFLSVNPSWLLLGASEPGFTLEDPDQVITSGPEAPVYTVFLLAPDLIDINEKFREFSFMDVKGSYLDAIRLEFNQLGCGGELRLHAKLTAAYGQDYPPFWCVQNKVLRVDSRDNVLVVPLSMAVPKNLPVTFQHIDIGLIWSGIPSPLRLTQKPQLSMS